MTLKLDMDEPNFRKVGSKSLKWGNFILSCNFNISFFRECSYQVGFAERSFPSKVVSPKQRREIYYTPSG